MVRRLQCFPNNTAGCDNALRTQMARFLSCFEGGLISEGQCPGNARTCMAVANLTDYYGDVMACYNDDDAVAAASRAMNYTCSAQKPKSWPTVIIDDVLMCEDDSCFMPLLPYLCKAYKSEPKPRSCQELAAADRLF